MRWCSASWPCASSGGSSTSRLLSVRQNENEEVDTRRVRAHWTSNSFRSGSGMVTQYSPCCVVAATKVAPDVASRATVSSRRARRSARGVPSGPPAFTSRCRHVQKRAPQPQQRYQAQSRPAPRPQAEGLTVPVGKHDAGPAEPVHLHSAEGPVLVTGQERPDQPRNNTVSVFAPGNPAPALLTSTPIRRACSSTRRHAQHARAISALRTGFLAAPATRSPRPRSAGTRAVACPVPRGIPGPPAGGVPGPGMICLQRAEVSDLAQLRQPFAGRAGGDPHAGPGQCDAVPGGA